MYVALKPTGNPLARFLPALGRIDAANGAESANVTGLDGFIQVGVHACLWLMGVCLAVWECLWACL